MEIGTGSQAGQCQQCWSQGHGLPLDLLHESGHAGLDGKQSRALLHKLATVYTTLLHILYWKCVQSKAAANGGGAGLASDLEQ
eukprot:scaffold142230_cov18-Tisochrysis_lutea.AAC.1